ncbi:MAG: carboxypeptidase-like regulatory domain-containing protein [Planctomycetota bacterium]
MKRRRVAFAVALLAFAAVTIVVTILLASPSLPVPPDYGRAAPVASLLELEAASASPADSTPRAAVAAPADADRSLRGRIVDPQGGGVADVRSSLWPAWSAQSKLDDGALPSDVAATSGADGRFTFPLRVAQPWGVRVAVDDPAWFAAEESVVLPFGQEQTIVVRRVHEVPLAVDVHERTTGVPVPRFRVTASTARRPPGLPDNVATLTAMAAPDGELGLHGKYRGVARFVEGLPLLITVQCAGHGKGEWFDRTDARLQETVQPRPGEPIHLTLAVDFDQAEALAAAVQRGRVVDAGTGIAIAGAELSTFLRVSNGTRSPRHVQSRTDGIFALAMPRDGSACTVRVEHDDYQGQERPADPTREFEFRLGRRGSLRVRVVDPRGQPLPGAAVLVKRQLERHDSFQERRRADARGEVHLTGLLAGFYYVNVLRRFGDSDDHALATDSWNLQAGQDLEVTIGTIAGDAVHVVGTVVGGPEGLVPMFVPHAGSRSWFRSRVQGRSYDAGGLPRGDHLIVLLPADDRSAGPLLLLPKVAVQGLGATAIDLAVPTGVLRGRLVGVQAGKAPWRVLATPRVPAGGLAHELLSSAKLRAAAGVAVAADGTFAVAGVADGEVVLEVLDGERPVARRTVVVAGGAEVGDWLVGG